jgi:hypothetical protein
MSGEIEVVMLCGFEPDRAVSFDGRERHLRMVFRRVGNGPWVPEYQLPISDAAGVLEQWRRSPEPNLHIHCAGCPELDGPLSRLVEWLAGQSKEKDWTWSARVVGSLFQAMAELRLTSEQVMEDYAFVVLSLARPATAHEKMSVLAGVMRRLKELEAGLPGR